MKIHQNFIKNQSKNDIEFKVGFRIGIFSSFYGFLKNFGPILAPKWPGFCPENRTWKRSRPPSGLQRPSGPHLGPFWDRFGSILGPFLAIFFNFKQKLKQICNQNYVCTNLSPYFGCTYLAHRRSYRRTSF